jgi:hypothetical protein
MKRRSFIQQSALAAGSFLLPAQKMFAQDGSIIVGQNDRKYKLNKAWSKADAMQFPVNDCHEMVQDKLGRIILLTNETKNNVMIYDRSGKLLSTWGHEYPGAHGLTLHNENGDDFLYICDNNLHKVFKTTIDGRVLLTLDYPKETGMYTKADEYIPTETAIAHNGDIYVADGYGKDFIMQYDAKGNFIRHFGGRGEGDKYLLNAHGVCMDYRDKKHPTLIVTSRQQNAFKRYTLDGEYINTIAMPGAWVCRPVIKGQYLYAAVLQSNNNQWKQSGFVTILDKHFKVVANLGGSEPVYKDGTLQEMSQTVKAFDYPHDVCIDNDENLYVAQWNSGKVYPYKLEPVA